MIHSNRKCARCGEPAMVPVSRKMKVFNSLYQYACTNCGHKIELVPAASLGIQITISLLVAGLFWVVILSDPGDSGFISLTFYVLLLSLLPGIVIYQLLKYRSYPIVKPVDRQTAMEVNGSKNITQILVIWIENKGFLAGLLAPVILIVVVLGSATIIGYINFAYFH